MSMIDHDLGLLATMVSYFVSMRTQLRLLVNICSRLERVASVFLQLAQHHVRTIKSIQPTSQTTTSLNSSRLQLPQDERNKHTSAGDDYAHNMSFAAYPPDDASARPFDIEGLDLDSYLQWLPADITTSWPTLGSERANVTTGTGVTATSNNSQSRKRVLDSTFDWFSWDAYYAGISQ